MSSRSRSLAIASTVAAATLMLAACGSQLDPDTVRAANGSAAGGDLAGGEVGAGGAGGDLPGGTTGGDAGSGGSGTTDSGASTAAGGGEATEGTGANSASGGAQGASCDGFKNQTGITDQTITIANSSDISGPVPGLFEAAQDATKAYVAYFNASSDICGRKLELMALDSRTDAGADQQSYVKACEGAFAAVGSMSGFDSGGASTAEKCGLPDIRSASVQPQRNACATCFAAQSANAAEFQNAVPDYVLKNFKNASQNAAMLYINAGAAVDNGKAQVSAMTKRGMKFTYVQGIDIAEFNYAPFVEQMESKGVEYVQFIGAYQQAVRLAEAMKQQSFKPDVYMLDPTAYDPRYVQSGGAAVEGTTIFLNFVPFEEAGSNKEIQLYIQWLQQVDPNATPTFFGVFAWSAARLFVQESIKLGGKLSRSTLVNELKGVDNWTANGLTSPQHVGSKRVGECWRFIKLKSGKWVPEGSTKYTCNGTTSS